LKEYIEKLTEMGISEKNIKKLLSAIFKLGREVSITFYHFPYYPVDPDDIVIFTHPCTPPVHGGSYPPRVRLLYAHNFITD